MRLDQHTKRKELPKDPILAAGPFPEEHIWPLYGAQKQAGIALEFGNTSNVTALRAENLHLTPRRKTSM
jgi:hypothetical protein